MANHLLIASREGLYPAEQAGCEWRIARRFWQAAHITRVAVQLPAPAEYMRPLKWAVGCDPMMTANPGDCFAGVKSVHPERTH